MDKILSIFILSISLVFLAMGILTSVVYFFRFLSSRHETVKETKKDELSEETLAIIAASCYMALKKRVKVHKVHVHREPYVERWSYAGRMDIHLSHKKAGVNQ